MTYRHDSSRTRPAALHLVGRHPQITGPDVSRGASPLHLHDDPTAESDGGGRSGVLDAMRGTTRTSGATDDAEADVRVPAVA